MEISQVAEDLYLVPLPIPVALRFVNAYLAKGRDGWTIIDTGFHDIGAQLAWEQAFTALGVKPGAVERIVVTHYHPDHYGGAGWLQELTRAPVLMLDREARMVEVVWRPGRDLSPFFARHGMPQGVVEELAVYQGQLRALTLPRPRVTPVSEGDVIPIGSRQYRVLWTPGHSEGLMVLWNEADRLLLANDMVLAKITPNISLWPDGDPDPLASFLASLQKVARLPARLTLTGHRAPIERLAERCAEIGAHHAERLLATRRAVAAQGAASAWDVALALFGPQQNVHNTRFALAEALAHLHYLTQRGWLVRQPGDVERYTSAESAASASALV